MKLGIMQPYFLPYIGYFQLIASVDKFVIYDNIKYTKKGWINRNRMLQNTTDKTFSISLVKASNKLDIIERSISPEFSRQKLLNQFRGCYLKAPYFEDAWGLIENIVLFEDDNLFRYIENSILLVCSYLNIKTEILTSSSISAKHELLSQERVLSICNELKAKIYINSIGGQELYSNENFAANDVELKFIEPNVIEYDQFQNHFVPWLSIIDVIMFNSKAECNKLVFQEYKLN